MNLVDHGNIMTFHSGHESQIQNQNTSERGRRSPKRTKWKSAWWYAYPSEKYETQFGMMIRNIWKNVPNHQLDSISSLYLIVLIIVAIVPENHPI